MVLNFFMHVRQSKAYASSLHLRNLRNFRKNDIINTSNIDTCSKLLKGVIKITKILICIAAMAAMFNMFNILKSLSIHTISKKAIITSIVLLLIVLAIDIYFWVFAKDIIIGILMLLIFCLCASLFLYRIIVKHKQDKIINDYYESFKK
mgnify:CR=1 FL=1